MYGSDGDIRFILVPLSLALSYLLCKLFFARFIVFSFKTIRRIVSGFVLSFSSPAILSVKAHEGNVDAQYRFGRLYLDGLRIEKNYDRAFLWLLKATSQHHKGAISYLYVLAERGHADARRFVDSLGKLDTISNDISIPTQLLCTVMLTSVFLSQISFIQERYDVVVAARRIEEANENEAQRLSSKPAPVVIYRTSFTCGDLHGLSRDQLVICTTKELAEADLVMVRLYSKLITAHRDNKENLNSLENSQRAWLTKKLNLTGNNETEYKAMLMELYDERIAELQAK
ncbi:hypothetical protein RsTz2092_08510 [Deferribacterales bacterium RsTz2092]|nr:hypothetical protein AGMMS49941_05810 [Deferribacterales bacterium]